MLRATLIVFIRIIGGLALYLGVTTLLGIVGDEPWMTLAFIASFAIAGGLATLLTRPLAAPAPVVNLSLEERERRGLLLREKYEAVRAFQVEEFEDEGSQYYVELKDGTVLFLCGQYLYDYEPADGKFQAKRDRQFPCTEFTLLRDKENRWIVDVVCGGIVLEPECEAPPFGQKELPPSDGKIIFSRSYHELKRERMKHWKR